MRHLTSRPLLCLVTERRRLLPPGASDHEACDQVVELAAAAATAGVSLIQIREPDLSARALATLASRCVAAVRGTGAAVLINDRADVALVSGAHGVHLRGDSVGASRLRPLLGPGALIGRSVHGEDEARAALAGGEVDYLVLGTLFATPSKPTGHPTLGLDALARVSRLGLPVLAIGGIDLDRVAWVAQAGAAGIAAIGLFAEAWRAAAGAGAGSLRALVAETTRRYRDACSDASGGRLFGCRQAGGSLSDRGAR